MLREIDWSEVLDEYRRYEAKAKSKTRVGRKLVEEIKSLIELKEYYENEYGKASEPSKQYYKEKIIDTIQQIETLITIEGEYRQNTLR